jgi:CBS domain-containing protein
MLVRDVLARKGSTVVTVSPETTIDILLSHLAEYNIGAALVSPDGEVLLGIVSERDVVRNLDHTGASPLSRPVTDIMTSEITTATPEDTIEHLMAVMTEERVRHIPVLVDGKLAGLVSIGDVVKSRMDELESEREHLISYISGS